MKKIITVSIFLGATFMLSGCGKTNQPIKEEMPSTAVDGGAPKEVQETAEKQSLLEKLLNRGAVKCNVEQDGNDMVILTNGTKVRIEGMTMPDSENMKDEQKKGYMISDGTWVYFWSGKEGMKFNVKEMEKNTKDPSGDNSEQQDSDFSDWKTMVKDMEESGAKYECSAVTLSESDFTPPTEVTFQDMNEFFKQMQSFSPQVPGGVNVPIAPVAQ